MNYRHIYHAGNRCDVVKHAALSLLLRHFLKKEAGFSVLDAFAGIGLYDLFDEKAQKTQEAEEGILRLLAARDEPLEALCPEYLAACRQVNAGGEIRFYPGSPLLIRSMMRPADRLLLCELHPDDFRTLRRHFHDDAQVQVHRRDAFEALHGLLPPSPRRGFVFLDPPFEEADSFERLPAAFAEINRRWPGACVALWYPIKDRPVLWTFHEALASLGLPDLLVAEFLFHEEIRSDRLNGSGLVLLNPPWQFDEALRALFPVLHRVLQTEVASRKKEEIWKLTV